MMKVKVKGGNLPLLNRCLQSYNMKQVKVKGGNLPLPNHHLHLKRR